MAMSWALEILVSDAGQESPALDRAGDRADVFV
jgi:hypothetical protein